MGSQDLKKDRSHAQQTAPPVHPPAAGMASTAHADGAVNGANGALSNGVPSSASEPVTVNGESSAIAAAVSATDPPPLDLSWRDGPANKPLGTLMQRTAAQCFFDLNRNLQAMIDVPVDPHHQQPNGVMPYGSPDASQSSVNKKAKLYDWAKDQRERFIKILVVADWSRNIEEKARLLDVESWINKQKAAHASSLQSIANIKNQMITAKHPSPNIEGAMEVLATGKASWTPDLGYVPPKRLPARQLLKTLRNMNVILATRLNAHEDLPPHFSNFTIADGRATFTVQSEFEVDLAVADEDPATPFYFIDIRLAFTPAPELINDRLRGVMERKVNDELASKGLKGCYEFLHSFTLTHKLNTLRSQALELLRGKWFDCIQVEYFRRRLIVQYWARMPGPKSWVEIGISSGKRKGYQYLPPTPHLAVRWFRKGIEVKDETLDFDWQDLNMERALFVVLNKHASWVMDDLKTRIEAVAPKASQFEANVSISGSTSELDGLSLSLPSLRKPLHLQIEPITGQYAISPPSQATRTTESRLNNDAAPDLSKLLVALPCAAVQERLSKEAALIGWSPLQHSTPQNGLQRLMNEPVRHFSIFRPSSAWGESWALAVTFSPAGEKYWAVSVKEQHDGQGKVMGRVIDSASVVVLPDATGNAPPVSRQTLLAVEKAAVAHVGLAVTGKQLKEMRIAHHLQMLPSEDIGGDDQGRTYTCNMALFVKFSALMSSQNKRKPWADEIVRLTHHGIVETREDGRDSGNVRHDLRLSAQRGLKELQKHVTRSKDRDLIMSQDGGLALKFSTPFGLPFVQQMQQRLRNVERLEGYLVALKERRFKPTHVSLSRLDFIYSLSPEYSASLSFGNDHIRLKLLPPDSNPHQRVRVLLENCLNGSDEEQFKTLTIVFALSLPVLKTFDQLEAKLSAKHAISIYPRTPTIFTVKYAPPLPSVEFQVKVKTTPNGPKKTGKWVICDVKSTTKGAALPDDLSKSVNELFQESGEHWQGIGNAILADPSGIAAAIERLDGVVRRFEGSTEASSAKPTDVVKEEEESKPSAAEIAKPTATSSSSAQPSKKSQTTAAGKAPNIKKEAEVVVLD